MQSMPEYEQALYTKARHLDMLYFNKEHTLVFDGHYMPDLPLAETLMQHKISGATVT